MRIKLVGEMKILQNRTIDQALSYWDEHVNLFPSANGNQIISEVYGTALEWKMKNCIGDNWRQYPINDVCISLIRGEL